MIKQKHMLAGALSQGSVGKTQINSLPSSCVRMYIRTTQTCSKACSRTYVHAMNLGSSEIAFELE